MPADCACAPAKIAALLHDPERDELHMRFRKSWEGLGEQDLDILEELAADLHHKAEEFGANGLIKWMRESWSHTFRISDPTSISTTNGATVLADVSLD